MRSQKHQIGSQKMYPATCKRQKHGHGHHSSPSTPSQLSIIDHNRCVRIQFAEQFNHLKYGSVFKDWEEINVKRHELISTLEKLQEVPIQLPYASPVLKSSDARVNSTGQNVNNFNPENFIDLDAYDVGDHKLAKVDNTGADTAIILVGTDDEGRVKSCSDENSSGSNQNANYIKECLLLEKSGQHQEIIMLDNVNSNAEAQFATKQGEDITAINNVFHNEDIALFDGHNILEPQQRINQGHHNVNFESHHEKAGREEGGESVQRKGIIEEGNISVIDSYELSCEVIPNESSINGTDNNQCDNNNPGDDLEMESLWRDMSVHWHVLSDHSIVPSEKSISEEEEYQCLHDFLMKDDLGIVCRVCGLIQQSIVHIFDYQWKKRKQLDRTYRSKHRIFSDMDVTANSLGAILEVAPDSLSIHPQHSQQMKPHQVEGFNFLIKNLVDENNPGGCILAHAPGSGKTFMLICFVHSFLAKYPAGRPLIILPKGILATWRTEFLHWQVEDIPLYDFYSSKTDNRIEQLKVLKLWEENRSILLLGYQQFASIVSDYSSDTEALMCREKLLKVPSLVVLDEGHTPRNEETDLLTSLANIRTPRKVVLSGTLFQNHVKEVFNILNLVRPRFLQMERSRTIVKRLLSKVDMLGKSARSKTISDQHFYDLVEKNLQKDANDKMRVMIIQNLRELTANVLHYYQGELLEELPGLVDFTVFLGLSSKQKEIIKSLAGLKKFEKHSKCNAVSLHPCLEDVKNICEKNGNNIDGKIGSIISGIDISDGVKANFVHNLLSLSEAAGEKVLVFSQYVRSLRFLEILITRMKGWKSDVHTFKIHGGSTQDQREQAVQKFNSSPNAKVFFGSIKACGEGISLVGASRIVILDVHENPSVMRQAIGRAFRLGQTKMVYCYRLVAGGSPEEEGHYTAFRKERVSKLWFEWNELYSDQDFELATVDVSDCEDRFLESPALQQDIKTLYKR